MGFAINVLLYYVTLTVKSNLLLYIICPLISVIWIINTVKGKSKEDVLGAMNLFRSTPATFYIFSALVFMYSIISTGYTYISPKYAAYSYLNIDFLYHGGIVNALSQTLTQGYPPLDPCHSVKGPDCTACSLIWQICSW